MLRPEVRHIVRKERPTKLRTSNLVAIEYENTDSEKFCGKNLCSHTMKVIKKGFRLDVGKFSFSNRVINEWNALSEKNYPE